MHLTTDKSWVLRENDDPVTRSVGGGGLPAVKACAYVREEAVGGLGVEAAQPVRPPAWTEEMLRSWEQSLHTVEELDVVWRVCSEPGPPGLWGQVIAEYISPELTGKPAFTALGVVSRRMNTAARPVWARGTPFEIDEVKRTRTVDRSVAVILLGALAEHPVWLGLRHHSSRPALGS